MLAAPCGTQGQCNICIAMKIDSMKQSFE